MTQEAQNPFQADELLKEMPIIRRSRSLSELPGHLRVPILQRKDTERTQARLEAGAAGVKELHALREQRQQIIDQTMATAQQKRKPQNQLRHKIHMADHHRLQQKQQTGSSRQQVHSCGSSLSTWHSTSSLASISEERDITSNVATNKLSGKSTNINVSDYSHYQDNILNVFGNSVIGNTQNYSYISQNCTRNQHCATFSSNPYMHLQNHNVLNNPHGNVINLRNLKTEESTNNDMNKMSEHREHTFKKSTFSKNTLDEEERNMSSIQETSTKSRSMSENYADHIKIHNPNDICQKQRSIHLQSPQHIFPSRSQSAQENVVCFADGKENDFQSNLHNQISSKNIKMQLHKSNRQPISSFSPQSRVKSKSISWDNLLHVIGLQSESGVTENDIMEQDNNDSDEVFENTIISKEDIGSLASSVQEKNPSGQIKRMRSQSFSSGSSITPCSEYRNLRTQCPSQRIFVQHEVNHLRNIAEQNEDLDIVHRQINEHKIKTTKEINSSLLRRASIQCEAVLTQTNSSRKVMNPLQDVDISSLQSPGPLHAVTLQFTTMSMIKSLDSKAITASSTSAQTQDKPALSKRAFNVITSSSEDSVHTYDNSQANIQSSHSDSPLLHVQFEQSDAMKKQCTSKVTKTNSLSEHPIPRPRTSILKEVPHDPPGAHCSSASEANEMCKETNDVFSKTVKHEESFSRDIKSDKLRVLYQSPSESDLGMFISNSPTLEKTEEAVSMTNTENMCCLNFSSLQKKDQNVNIFKCKQNSAPHFSALESENVEMNTLIKQGINMKNVYNLPSHKACSNIDKTSTNSNIDIADKKCTNKLDVISSQSLQHKTNFTAGRSRKVKADDSQCMASFVSSTQKHFLQNSDVSIFSDDGYSTCDSISTQFQHTNCGHCQSHNVNSSLSSNVNSSFNSNVNSSFNSNVNSSLSSNMNSSLSSNATVKTNLVEELPCSSNKHSSASQIQCEPSNMKGASYVNFNENKADNKIKYNSTTESNVRTESVTTDNFQHTIKPNSIGFSDLSSYKNHGSRSTLNNRYNCINKETTVSTEIKNEKDLSKNVNNTTTDTNKNNSKDDQVTGITMEIEEQEKNGVEILPVTRQLYDSTNNMNKNIIHTFRQTAV